MREEIRPEKKEHRINLVQGIVYDRQPVENGMRDLHLSLLTPYGRRSTDHEKRPCVVWVCGGA